MQEKISAQYVNEIQMAKAQRDYELKKASYDIEVNTKKAESEMAYQLQVCPWYYTKTWMYCIAHPISLFVCSQNGKQLTKPIETKQHKGKTQNKEKKYRGKT